jgi:tRNA nucleotidyltransferase (CCA-adding enzyme)
MARGKKRRGHAHGASETERLRRRLRELCASLQLEAYEVGGCLRDELRGVQPKDIDLVVCGVSFAELAAGLEKAGQVEPNIVGGGRLALRTGDGALHVRGAGESFRELRRRVGEPATPEVVGGEGTIVGCRFFSEWTPPGGVEISLARNERSTASGRRHFQVATDPQLTIYEDLARRDFTCNALARRLSDGELLDPFGGARDIASGALRVLSAESFAEDPSRILRGLVRIAEDGFTPDEATLESMSRHASLLSHEPVEQIYLELERILRGAEAARALRYARASGVLAVVLPELADMVGFRQESPYHDLTCDEHSLRALEEACRLDAPLSVRWAALFHDSGKPEAAFRGEDGRLHYYGSPEHGKRPHQEIGAERARRALVRLRQPPSKLISAVEELVAEHMFCDDAKPSAFRARKFIRRVGRERAEELLLLRRCDRAAKREGGLSAEDEAELARWEELVRSQLDAPLYPHELPVSGHDALRFGFRGPAIGALLEELSLLVLADVDLNERRRLLGLIRRRALKAGLLAEHEAERLLSELAS